MLHWIQASSGRKTTADDTLPCFSEAHRVLSIGAELAREPTLYYLFCGVRAVSPCFLSSHGTSVGVPSRPKAFLRSLQLRASDGELKLLTSMFNRSGTVHSDGKEEQTSSSQWLGSSGVSRRRLSHG